VPREGAWKGLRRAEEKLERERERMAAAAMDGVAKTNVLVEQIRKGLRNYWGLTSS
jgi:hypothetical protein